MDDKKQDSRIKKYIRKFRKFCEDLSVSEKEIAYHLIEEIAFMKVTIEDLKEEVKKEGVITEMEQGEYSIKRENPALKSYNTTVQRYNSTIKQLDEFINKNNANLSQNENELIGFLQKK